MSEQGDCTRVHWSPRADRSWCPGATLPGQLGCSGQVETGWTTFFKLQGVLIGLRRNRQAEATSVDDVPGALPGFPRQTRPSTAPAPERE